MRSIASFKMGIFFLFIFFFGRVVERSPPRKQRIFYFFLIGF